MSDVTMQELESETAELLPSRETLWCGCGGFLSGNNILSGNVVQVGVLSYQQASTTTIAY